MNSKELKKIVDSHREEILKAMKEADRCAYKYPTCKYSVAIFPDGHTEQRERLAGDNWWYLNDPAILEIGSFCHQYYDVLRDNLASDELLGLLETDMDPSDKVKYGNWREEYEEEWEEEPDDWDAVSWIEEHLFEFWERERDLTIDELVDEGEAQGFYERELDAEIELKNLCDEEG